VSGTKIASAWGQHGSAISSYGGRHKGSRSSQTERDLSVACAAAAWKQAVADRQALQSFC
jgi:hypothetical protein